MRRNTDDDEKKEINSHRSVSLSYGSLWDIHWNLREMNEKW